ncbi:MAG: serine hydrolase [Gemmatimonadota bacterium]
MRPTRALLSLLIGLSACTGSNPRPPGQERQDARLQARLDSLVQGFHGDVGIYVRHLGDGRSAWIQPDTLFPTASMIKVPILLTTFERIEQGALDFDQALVYRDSLLYEGEDILGSFKDGEEIALSKVVMLMITMSDNTASLWLQDLVGTGTAINEWLSQHGFERTRVNSRTEGRRSDWEVYGWGQTTPREMAELLVRIREGRAVSPGADEEMYRVLSRIYWNDEALSQIPPWVQAASKQGAVDRSRSEVVLVNAPHGDYVFSVITKNQEDSSWGADNEGFVLLRDVSRLLWSTFEPGTTWTAQPFPMHD